MTVYAVHWFLPLPEPIAIPEVPGIMHFTHQGAAPGLDIEVHLTPHHIMGPLPEDGHADAMLVLRDAMPILELDPLPVDPPAPLDRAVTVVEAVVVYPEGQFPHERRTSDGFDRVLESVAAMQRGYHSATKRPLRIIQREQLPVALPHAVLSRDGDDEWKAEGGVRIMMAHSNVPLLEHPEPLAGDELDRVLHAVGMGLAPYFNLTDLRREAAVALSRGEYGAAAVLCATASEIFLETLLLIMLWEEGRTPDEAAATFETRAGLTGRVKTEYHPRVGGSWKLDGASPVSRWWKSTAMLRHRVVHAAYPATQSEAIESLEALQALERWVMDLLSRPSKLKAYPASVYLYASDAGLRRRRVSEKRIADILEKAREEQWLGAFVLWRASVIELRATPWSSTSAPESAY